MLYSDQVTEEYSRIFHFFTFRKSWAVLAVHLGSISSCDTKGYPVSFGAIWLNLSIEYSSIPLRIHPDTSIGSHIIALHIISNPLLHWWRCFWIVDCNDSPISTEPLTCLHVLRVFFSSKKEFCNHPLCLLVVVFCGFFWPYDVVELTSAFFPLRLCRIVDLATPKVFPLSLIDLFCFVCPNMGPLHLHWYLFGLPIWKAVKCQFNTWNQLMTFYLLHLSWINDGIDQTWPCNCLSVNCPKWSWVQFF